MGQWSIGKNPLNRKMLILNNDSFDDSIPIFHHSIIPCARQKPSLYKDY
jgi:hypothetical protein